MGVICICGRGQSFAPTRQVRPLARPPQAETPAVAKIEFDDATGAAHVSLVSRHHPPRDNSTVLYTTDNSWPQLGAPGTTAVPLAQGQEVDVVVGRTCAVNARLVVDGLLPSLTMTLVVPVPAASADLPA